jgi:hypothetical protein
MRRPSIVFSIVSTILLAIPMISSAQDVAEVPGAHERFRQHEATKIRGGSGAGALGAASVEQPAVTRNFRIVGHHALSSREVHADVALFDYGGGVGVHAFVGSWGGRCAGTGVKIVDASHPARPRLVAIAGSHPGESHEDVDVLRIGPRIVMGVGVQVCDDNGRAGLLRWT